jgi:hypothetical protein
MIWYGVDLSIHRTRCLPPLVGATNGFGRLWPGLALVVDPGSNERGTCGRTPSALRVG